MTEDKKLFKEFIKEKRNLNELEETVLKQISNKFLNANLMSAEIYFDDDVLCVKLVNRVVYMCDVNYMIRMIEGFGVDVFNVVFDFENKQIKFYLDPQGG